MLLRQIFTIFDMMLLRQIFTIFDISMHLNHVSNSEMISHLLFNLLPNFF
jgi:hypothetical protein